jgi:gamma-resorcylate decarboxylase
MRGKIAFEERFVTPDLKDTIVRGVGWDPQEWAAMGAALQDTGEAHLGDNFYLTMSGNFHTPALVGAILHVGAGRLPFDADYPFERTADSAGWFDAVPISETGRRKTGRMSAATLLGLP